MEFGKYDDLNSDHLPIKFRVNWETTNSERRRGRNCVQARIKKSLQIREKVWIKCNKSKVFVQIEKIKEMQKSTTILTKRDGKIIRRCDTLFTKFMIKAEKTKLIHSYAEWAPAIHQVWKVVKLYKTWYNAIKKNKETKLKNRLTRLATDATETYTPYQDMASIKKKLKSALRKIRKLRKNAPTLRFEYLSEAAEAAQLKSNATKAQLLKNLIHQEEVRRKFRIIKETLKPKSQSQITKITIPTQDGWQQLTDANQIENEKRDEVQQ